MSTERILVVEDEKIIALDLRRRLEKFGYEVVGTAGTAEEAVNAASETAPDLVLMDVMLTGSEDGIDAAAAIRRENPIPIVFLTAYADEETLERAKHVEPVGYVLKPFKERELYTTIEMGLYKSKIDRVMRRHERLFSSILNSTGDGIIATDSRSNIRYINPVAATLTGWRAEDAQGKQLSAVFSLANEQTGEPITLPAPAEDDLDTARVFEGVLLTSKQGATISIDGNVALIRDEHGNVDGQAIAFRDLTDIKHMSATISYQASHDSLTGLLNRDEFATQLGRVCDQARGEDREHTFLYIDVDQFKVVNDVCGHLAGDELLRQIAGDIDEVITHDHLLARLGGDEFGLVIFDCKLDAGRRLAKVLLAHLNRRFIWHQHSFNVSASIGIVKIDAENNGVNDVLAAADDACCLAKEHGGNSLRVYEHTDNTFLKRRGEMQWIGRLSDALEEDRFVLFGQPIKSLDGKHPDKIEILLRLQDRNNELVSPGLFISAAERYKLMPAIDRWVINASFKYVRQCMEMGVSPPILCINLSGASIAEPTLLDFILFMLERHDVPASKFVLEVTETSAIQNLSRALSFMDRLRSEGATFALDDFGNGFSSFAYLKKLPVDYLKIDGSFVVGIDTDPIGRAMVNAVNTIGHTMDMLTIAEYVTSDSLRETLTEIGVDYGQGFALAKPHPLVLPKPPDADHDEGAGSSENGHDAVGSFADHHTN